LTESQKRLTDRVDDLATAMEESSPDALRRIIMDGYSQEDLQELAQQDPVLAAKMLMQALASPPASPPASPSAMSSIAEESAQEEAPSTVEEAPGQALAVAGDDGTPLAEGHAPQAATRRRAGDLDLLLVDDDLVFRTTLARFLESLGYGVRQASNGIEALALITEKRPDMVLSDIFMPRMNGFKLLLEVKTLDTDFPFLLMTGSSSAVQVFESCKYPNTSLLSKPFRLKTLDGRIREVLGVEP
jgi:two-component system chemotaxis response regulator CheY